MISPIEQEWKQFFKEVFEHTQEYLRKRYPLEKDGSGNPRFVAIRNAIDQLPCGIKILELKLDNQKFPYAKENFAIMIHYDVTKLGDLYVQYLGSFLPTDSKLPELLKTEFHMHHPEKVIESWNDKYPIIFQSDTSFVSNYQLVYYDPRTDSNKFEFKFIYHLEHDVIPAFAKYDDVLPDFNKLYRLDIESEFSEKDMLTKYSGLYSILNLEDVQERNDAFKDLQIGISKSNLIPHVNEYVKRVFNRAKQLYLFGWYGYDLFVVSEHNAVLALESAIKHRYFAHFETDVVLRNKNDDEHRIQNATYDKIDDFLQHNDNKSWKIFNLTINNEKFLYKMNDLLDWLVENKIISEWERQRCDSRMEMRNYLSHPTHSPILPPGYAKSAINEVAYLVNKMFSSL